MNAFERAEARRKLLSVCAPGIWAQFRSALKSLVESHNKTERGQYIPARLKPEEDECATVIEQIRGRDVDEFHTIVVVITVQFEANTYIIAAAAEKWRTREGRNIRMLKRKTYSFTLDGDTETQRCWLASDGGETTAFAAAEAVLTEVLSQEW